MKELLKQFRWWVVFWVWILFILFLWWTIYASWTNISDLKKSTWEQLTSATWNNLINNVDYLNWWLKIPVWLVSAFNLQKCPSGWKPANWADWTVDLRWKFIRGLNSFESWANKLSWDDSDIDWVDRTLWSYQNDAIRNITWNLWRTADDYNKQSSGAFTQTNIGSYYINAAHLWSIYTFVTQFDASNSSWVTVWADNRPKNVWLIYCEKE